jgi:DNA-binding PucR family transcriptional regulator
VAVGRDVYLLLADGSRPADDRLEAMAQEILGDRGDTFPAGTVAGVGSVVDGLVEATRSLDEARRVAAVLDAASGASRVASIERVRSHAIVERIAEIAAAEPGLLKGPLEKLYERDREGRGHYADTLRAFLDHFGDVTAASASLDVHPNTFRYRMRRLLEISGLDLDDPVERMVAHLQLRIRDSQQ